MDTYAGNMYAARGVTGPVVEERPHGVELAPGPGVVPGGPLDVAPDRGPTPEWVPEWAPAKGSLDYVQTMLTTLFLALGAAWLVEQVARGRGGVVRSVGRAKAGG